MPSEYPETLSVARSPRATSCEQLVDPAGGHGGAGRGERAQVLAARQERVERRRLDQRADVEQALAVAAPERPPEELDLPAVRADEAGQDAHRRGLAGAVRAEEAVHDARRHAQVEPVEGHLGPVALGQTLASRRATPGSARHCRLPGLRRTRRPGAGTHQTIAHRHDHLADGAYGQEHGSPRLARLAYFRRAPGDRPPNADRPKNRRAVVTAGTCRPLRVVRHPAPDRPSDPTSSARATQTSAFHAAPSLAADGHHSHRRHAPCMAFRQRGGKTIAR